MMLLAPLLTRLRRRCRSAKKKTKKRVQVELEPVVDEEELERERAVATEQARRDAETSARLAAEQQVRDSNPLYQDPFAPPVVKKEEPEPEPVPRKRQVNLKDRRVNAWSSLFDGKPKADLDNKYRVIREGGIVVREDVEMDSPAK